MKKLYIILAVLFLAAIGTFTYFYRKGFSNNIRGNEGYVSGTNNKSEITRNIEESKSDNFSFAIIGDTKSFGANNPDGNLQKAVKSINKNNPDFAFVMGDLVSSCDGGSSCVKKFDDWKKVLGSLVNKTYEVVGNHDRTGGSKADKVWQDEFSLPQNGPDDFKGQTFSFDFGNSHFVVLDSEKPKENIINDVQRTWLDQDLSQNKKQNVFVFYHEPAFGMAKATEDGLDAKPEERDLFWNIIKKYKVTAVFNGHEHIFARGKIDGIYQIVVGDTNSTDDDFPDPKLSDYAYKWKSYAIVSVNGMDINLKLYSVDGNLIDSFDFAN